MTDLDSQYRILYYLYENFNKGIVSTESDLKQKEELFYMHYEKFKAELSYKGWIC
jgi:hypothetical protein